MIGKLLMRRAQKAKRLSSSALQRLRPGMIGILLILCPTKLGPHATSPVLVVSVRSARSAPRTEGGLLGDCPDHSCLILGTLLTHTCPRAASTNRLTWIKAGARI